MARLATLTLQNQQTGRKIIVNQADYAADIARWNAWKIVRETRGEVSPAEEAARQAARMEDLERHQQIADNPDTERRRREEAEADNAEITEQKVAEAMSRVDEGEANALAQKIAQGQAGNADSGSGQQPKKRGRKTGAKKPGSGSASGHSGQ